MGAISTIESDEKGESPDYEYYGTSSTVSFMRMAHQSIKRHSMGGRRAVNSPSNRRNQQESIATIINDASKPARFTFEDFALPPRSLADHLLECFSERMFCLYPFFHWKSFYEAYENLWVPNKQPVRRLTKLNIGLGSVWDSGPQSLVFHISLNLMFALGCQFADIPETRRQELGFNFFMRAKQHIGLDMLDIRSIGVVQALLITTLYLQSTPYPNRCWNSIGVACRVAQGLGLHRAADHNEVHPLELEIRRRTWHCCVIMDMFVTVPYLTPMAVSSY